MASGTAAEKLLRATLWEFGIRFRTTEPIEDNVYPTLSLPQCKVAVFVTCCYDGRCPWDYPDRKASSRVWKKTQVFDQHLKEAGWLVVRVWQHEVEQTPRLVAGRVASIIRAVQKALELNGL